MSKQKKDSPQLIIAGVVGNNIETKKDAKENSSNIELRSGEVQELMNRPPGLILKSGITVILMLVIVFFALSSFLTYPEQLTTTAKLFPAMPMECVESPIDGRLAWVINGLNRDVKKGDTLAMICHSADTMYLTSKVNGRAYLTDVLERNMIVKAGQSLFKIAEVINKKQTRKVHGVIYLPIDSVLVLKSGQIAEVNYKGASFPFQISEFGSIANKEGKYPISITFVDSLNNFNNIESENCMAMIKMSNQTVFEKFFAKQLNILNKYRVP